MLFSIITINRNDAAGLEKTIRSVIGQTYSDFEFIIVDGASTDNSVEVIRSLVDDERMADRKFAWISEPDKGIYNAMNKGTRMAHGDYLLFLNSGDAFASPEVLSTVAQKVLPFGENLGGSTLGEDSSAISPSFLIGRVNVVDGDKVITQSKLLTDEDLTLFNMYMWGVPHQASFIRRELLVRNPYDETLRINADWKFFMQEIVMNGAKVLLLPDIIANYDNSGISSTQMDKLLKEREDTFCSIVPERIALNYAKVFPHYYEVNRIHWLLRHPFFYKVYRAWASIGMRIKK